MSSCSPETRVWSSSPIAIATANTAVPMPISQASRVPSRMITSAIAARPTAATAQSSQNSRSCSTPVLRRHRRTGTASWIGRRTATAMIVVIGMSGSTYWPITGATSTCEPVRTVCPASVPTSGTASIVPGPKTCVSPENVEPTTDHAASRPKRPGSSLPSG